MKWPFNHSRRLEADVSLLAVGALVGEERAKVEAHVTDCAACRAKLAELRKLTGELESLGERLPQMEPTIALRRRWRTAVRQSARPETEHSWAWLWEWLFGRHAAWRGLAAIWLLVLLLCVSAPEAPKPVVGATAPISLREVLLALQVENGKSKQRADAGYPFRENQSHPTVSPPQSRIWRVRPDGAEAA